MRALGIAPDPHSAVGGSTHDLLLADDDPIAFPDPTIWIPYQDGQGNIEPGESRSSRANYGFGKRGNRVDKPWSNSPSLTGTTLATPKMCRTIIPRALGEVVAPTGTAPAPITSTFKPKQGGILPSICGRVIREGQTDDISGVWINTFALALPVDGEGTLAFAGPGLYHEVSETTGSDPTTDYSGNDYTYEIRSAKVYDGAAGTDLIECVSSLTFNYGNALVDDARTRFCAGKNVVDKLSGGNRYRVWYPDKNRMGAQTMSVTLDFGEVSPDRDLLKLFSIAEKLVIEASAGPIATTPPSTDMIRIAIGEAAITGGGADALKREGEIFSSYEYQGGIDAAGNDLEVSFAGLAAVTV
jgi:hypothetical protein